MSAPLCTLGRYALYDEIASGGMATVHFGRLLGPVGFSRTVAIKRLHPQFARNPDFVAMFLDEARLAARVRHPNVVPTLDVVSEGDELFLVMEYVQGESLSKLARAAHARGDKIDPRIIVSVMVNMLDGLHEAHEARSETGEPLNIVHRDISPQNVLVGADGVARVLDFGVAKASGRIQVTREGQLKGKLSYMAPEQLEAKPFDRRVDVFASGVVLWEMLAGRRLFDGASEAIVFGQILSLSIEPPSQVRPGLPAALDRVVMRALEREPRDRYATAQEMAAALERALAPATAREVAAWMQGLASKELKQRADCISRIESSVGLRVTSASNAAHSDKDDWVESNDDLPTRIQATQSTHEWVPPAAEAAPPSQRDRLSAPPSQRTTPPSHRERVNEAPSPPAGPPSRPDPGHSLPTPPSSVDPVAALLYGPTGRPPVRRAPSRVVVAEENPAGRIIRWMLLLSLGGLVLAVLTPSGREGFAALASDLAALFSGAASSASPRTPPPATPSPRSRP